MRRDYAIDTAGGTFHYLSWGRSEAPPVLCLHGFPDHPPSFAPMAERLAARGYRVVAPWTRGYAPSVSEGPFDIDRLAQDAIELATAFGQARPIPIVGHDWGAVATYAACAAAPARFRCAVTLSVPHPLAFVRGLRTPAQLRKSWYMFFFQLPALPERVAARGDFIDRLWRAWSPGYRLEGEARGELLRCLEASMPAPIEYYRAMIRPARDALLRLRRAKEPLSVPTLYLHGADDGCIGAELAGGQRRFFAGDFDSEVLGGAGHFLQLERPGAVADRVAGWLERHGARGLS